MRKANRREEGPLRRLFLVHVVLLGVRIAENVWKEERRKPFLRSSVFLIDVFITYSVAFQYLFRVFFVL